MQIIKEQFQIKITGKCTTENDMLQLFDFGYSIEDIVRKYKKDNKIKISEARKIVWEVLFKNRNRRVKND